MEWVKKKSQQLHEIRIPDSSVNKSVIQNVYIYKRSINSKHILFYKH